MDGFRDFNNNIWHIFPHTLDLLEREQIRIAAHFGLTYDDLEEVDAHAVMIANANAPHVPNLFSDLSSFIGTCKMKALVSKICEVKDLNESDFTIHVDCDNNVESPIIAVEYKGKRL